MIAYFKNGKVYNPVAVSTVPGKKVICFITKVNLYVLIGLLFAMTCGCQSGPRSQQVQQSQSLGKAIDPIRLMSELRIQMDDALAEVIAFSTEIAATHQDRRVRENMLRWKMRFFDAYLYIMAIDDPRVAFLIEWTVIVKLRQHATEVPWTDDPLSQSQQKRLAMVKNIEENIINLGYRHFPPETIDAAKDEIEESAHYFPWHTPVGYEAAIHEAKQENDLLKIITLPLASVTSLGKVGDAPEAIHRFTNTANDFSLVIQHLPERTRWQFELLLLEMESSGPVFAMIQQMDRFDKTLQNMGTTFKSLPADVRTEFEQSLAAMEKLQPEFRATLAEARAVTENARIAIETASQTTLQAQEAAVRFTETAKALETTASEVRALLADYKEMQQSKKPKDPNQSGAGIKDYQEAAESFTTAAREIRSGLNDLQKPLDDQAALRQVAGEFRQLTDMVFWRAVMLITIIFVLVLGYYLTKSRFRQNS